MTTLHASERGARPCAPSARLWSTAWLLVFAIIAASAGCARETGAVAEPAGHGHADGDDHGHAHDAADGHAADAGGADGDHAADSTRITAAMAKASGIEVAPAGPGTIADAHEMQGLLLPPDGAAAQVAARFPGVVRRLHANVGDRVRAGQAMAVVESNLSLSTYTVTAPIAGTVMSRGTGVGAVVGEGGALYEVADLSRLWVDLHVFGFDAQHIAPGATVEVTRLSDGATATSTIERVLPGAATASQSTVARAVVDNADGHWRPGTAVRARITVDEAPAAIVVPLAALQDWEGADAVFVRAGETYTARPVRLGRRDATRVEVLDGLRAGEQVVVGQSYVVKADLGKAGAGHDH